MSIPNGHEIVGKNLFSGLNEAQGGAILEQSDSIDKSGSRVNSTKDSIHNSYPLDNNSRKSANLPIFKLLQAFKLQQYAKTFVDLGYGHEVYKVAILLPRQRHELLNKLNLMPGHRARFLSLFEIIDQIYPKEEKFRMVMEFKRPGKSRAGTATNFMPKPDNSDNSSKSSNKRRSLIKQYNSLDKRAKKEVNEKFIRKIKENKPNAYMNSQNINLQNILHEHVSQSKTRKAIKKIFPPSMYDAKAFLDEYDKAESRSNSRSKSKRSGRENSSKRRQKVHNIVKKNMLPPLPEIHAGGKYNSKYVSKTKNPQNFEIRRASTGLNNSKANSMSQKGLQRGSDRKRQDLEIQAMSATKYSHYGNYNRPKSGSKKRKMSEEAKKNKKPASLSREIKKNARQRTAKNWNNTRKNKTKSKSRSNKSKSSSNKRKNGSRDGVLSTSAASNAGRLISSASTSDKRSVKNKNTSSFVNQNNQLPKINEKPVQKFIKPITQKPPSKTVSKLTNPAAVKIKKNPVAKSGRADISKDRKSSISGTILGDKDQSEDIKKFGSIFTESDEKKIKRRNQNSDLNSQSKIEQSFTENQRSSCEKSKIGASISNEIQIKHSPNGII